MHTQHTHDTRHTTHTHTHTHTHLDADQVKEASDALRVLSLSLETVLEMVHLVEDDECGAADVVLADVVNAPLQRC